MGSELVSVVRRNALEVSDDRSDQRAKDTVSQASLELSLYRKYGLTQRPNVQVERTVLIHRIRESKGEQMSKI